MDDNWYELNDYSKYEINKHGDIRNKESKKILAKQYSNYGYRVNTLVGDDGKIHCLRVHILVAKQFIDNPNNYPIVNHIDEDRRNPDVSNLEWSTFKKNILYGECISKISKAHEICINEYTSNGIYIRTWKSIKKFSDYYSVNSAYISKILDQDGKFVKGRIVKRYTGSKANIHVNKVNTNEIDYSVYGKVNENDLLTELDTKNKLNEIYEREMRAYVSQGQIKKDMRYLKEYIQELENEIDQLSKVIPE